MTKMFRLFLFCLFIIATTPAMATTYYMDNSASGNNDGSSWTDAWESFADANTAIDALGDNGSGDTVLVRDGSGTYGEFIDDLARTDWLTWQADTGHTPDFKCLTVGDNTGAEYDAYLKLVGLDIRMTDASLTRAGGSQGGVLYSNEANYIYLDDCYVWCFNRWGAVGVDYGAHFATSDNVTVKDTEFAYAVPDPIDPYEETPGGTDGLEFANCDGFLVDHCYIHDFSGSGILVTGTSGEGGTIQDTRIYYQHQTCPGEPGSIHGSGLALTCDGCTGMTVKRCIIQAAGKGKNVGIYTYPMENFTFVSNLVFDSTGAQLFENINTQMLGDNCIFNNNTLVADWQAETPTENVERYDTVLQLSFKSGYGGDFEFYNNMIVGKLEHLVDSHGTEWADSTEYSVDDISKVTADKLVYKCTQNHTSDTANDKPGSGTNWTDYWEYNTAPVIDAGNNVVYCYHSPFVYQSCYNRSYDKLANSKILCSDCSGYGYNYLVDENGFDGSGIGWDPEKTIFLAGTGAVINDDSYHLQWIDYHPLDDNSCLKNYGDETKAIAAGVSLGSLNSATGFINQDGIVRSSLHHNAGCYEDFTQYLIAKD